MSVTSRILIVVILLSIPFTQSVVHAQDIVIAAREDAGPFVFRDAKTNAYRGFFWDICTLAVQRAGYFPRKPDTTFTAEDRTTYLNGASPNGAAMDYDLLCDPTTITIDRMNTFVANGSYLTFSPIVFVANGTYVSRASVNKVNRGSGKIPPAVKKAGSRCEDLNVWAQETSMVKNDTKEEVQQDQDWISFFPKQTTDVKARDKESYEIWGSLAGSTIDEKLTQAEILASVNNNSSAVVCATAFSSHQDAARAFCEGRLARYYGDAEIIKSAIRAHEEENGETCKFVTAPLGTYEPYAFVLSSRKFRDFPLKFTLALYTMFSDQTIERLFSAHFSEEKSNYLDILFRINRIPYGLPAKSH
jgi:ABC-type amino acid transport substrate-binding protein